MAEGANRRGIFAHAPRPIRTAPARRPNWKRSCCAGDCRRAGRLSCSVPGTLDHASGLTARGASPVAPVAEPRTAGPERENAVIARATPTGSVSDPLPSEE